jgi:hypothetical protein
MRNLLLSASVAACLLACGARDAGITTASSTPAVYLTGATLFKAGYSLPVGAQSLTTGSGFRYSVGVNADTGYYVLCGKRGNAEEKCLPIVPVKLMQGISVRADIALDGESPVVWFEQSENLTPDASARQSFAIGVFNERFWDVLEQFNSANVAMPTNAAMRSGRESRTAPQKDDSGSSGESADPASGRTPYMQTVDVPGERPDPEYPSPYDPLPPPDLSPTDNPGSSGGEDPGNAYSDENRYERMAANCLPAPGRPAAIACVYVPGKRPPPIDPLNPPTTDVPPPPGSHPEYDWCGLLGIGCTVGGQRPPDPSEDIRRAMCNSRYIVKGAVCVYKRLIGEFNEIDEQKCLDMQYNALGQCLTKETPLLAPAKQ